MPRAGGDRIAICHSNIPNMVGQISTCLADAGLNIEDMLNKSKGEVAYTLADIDSKVDLSVVPQIEAIEGVLSVRVLS